MVDLDKQIAPVVQDANTLMIATDAQAGATVEVLNTVNKLIKEVNDTFDPIIDKANKAHKEAIAQRNRHRDPLTSAKAIITDKVAGYQREQKRLADLEAQKQADLIRKEREALAKKAQARIDALADKSLDISEQIAALEKVLEDPTLSDEEAQVYQGKINMLLVRQNQANGAIQVKQAEVETIVAAPIPQAATSNFKVPGLTTRSSKVGVVSDFAKLVKSVAAGTVPIGVLTFDQGTINKLANAGMIMPGVDISTKETNYTRANRAA